MRLSGTAVVLAALLLTGAVAHADESRQHGAPSFDTVKGLVTFVSSSSMHVQTQNASVTVGLSSSTAVTRIVVGSTADLAKGEQVEARFTMPGSGVIKFIHIDLAPPSRETGSSARHHGGRFLYERSPLSWSDSASWKVSGQVVALGSGSVTIRSARGTDTYSLASNMKVTKTMNGRVGDVAFGETVNATVNHSSGVASAVCILSS